MSDRPVFEFVRGDAEWTRLRNRCLSDLYWFAGVVLGYGDKVHMLPRVHGLMSKFTDRSIGIPEIDECPFRKVTVPREIGKTTLIAQAYALQRVLQNQNISILIASERLEMATSILKAIKGEMMTNTLLRELFPDVIPLDDQQTVWAEDKIEVTRTTPRKDPSIFCIGVGGTVTGFHPDLILCDDLLSREAAENARTGNTDLTGKLNRWISQLRPLLNAWAQPYPEIMFIGTRWFAGDSYEYVEDVFGYGERPRVWQVTQKLETGLTQTVTVYRVGDLAVFKRSIIEDGQSIWPENPKFTAEALAKFRLTDPELFAANMMNEPSDEVTAVLKEHWLRFYDWLDKRTIRLHVPEGPALVIGLQDLDCVMLVDPGGFKKRSGGDRARPALVITGTANQTFQHVILEAWSDPVTYKQVIDQMFAFLSRYPIRKVAIEVAGQQEAFVELIRRDPRMKDTNAVIDTVSPGNEDKDQRILTLEPYFQRGQMYLGKGPAFSEFREQYRTFPRSRRKDVLDALANGPKVWRHASLFGKSVQQRQQWERQEYYRRRGMSLLRSA